MLNYKVIELKGNVPTVYHSCVIEVSDGVYYKGYEDNSIKTTTDIRFATHIAPKFGEETVVFLKRFFDDEGNRRREDENSQEAREVPSSSEMARKKTDDSIDTLSNPEIIVMAAAGDAGAEKVAGLKLVTIRNTNLPPEKDNLVFGYVPMGDDLANVGWWNVSGKKPVYVKRHTAVQLEHVQKIVNEITNR